MNGTRIGSVVSELSAISDDARRLFGRLNDRQLNWKPSASEWSVAQCLDHLITINGLYFPIFEKLRSGPTAPSFWERYSPFSGFFGRYLIKVLGPEYEKKAKTSKKAYPSGSDIDGEIVERFVQHNADLAALINGLAGSIDLEETTITSPLISFVTYSMSDTLTLLTVHERRHLQQGLRVTEMDGFPV